MIAHFVSLCVIPPINAPRCGKKLHNIRQGRLAPELRDEAFAIVRRELGDSPESADLLHYLQGAIDMSVARHEWGAHGTRQLRRRGPIAKATPWSPDTGTVVQAVPSPWSAAPSLHPVTASPYGAVQPVAPLVHPVRSSQAPPSASAVLNTGGYPPVPVAGSLPGGSSVPLDYHRLPPHMPAANQQPGLMRGYPPVPVAGSLPGGSSVPLDYHRLPPHMPAATPQPGLAPSAGAGVQRVHHVTHHMWYGVDTPMVRSGAPHAVQPVLPHAVVPHAMPPHAPIPTPPQMSVASCAAPHIAPAVPALQHSPPIPVPPYSHQLAYPPPEQPQLPVHHSCAPEHRQWEHTAASASSYYLWP